MNKMDIIEHINIPIEHVYLFDTSTDSKPIITRDTDKLNRFWFAFPAEWRTSNNTERIIGIRSLYLDRSERVIYFNLTIKKTATDSSGTVKTNEVQVLIYFVWKRDLTYRDLDETIYQTLIKTIEENKEQWETEGKPSLTGHDVLFVWDTEDDLYNIELIALETYVEDGTTYETEFKISEVSEDFKQVFLVAGGELPTDYVKEIKFPYVWDRYHVLLRSSIATNSIHNFLGYSGTRYTPIKYYRYSAQDNKFWIDMYAGHDHKSAVAIPKDGKDVFELEIVLLHNAKKLY